MSFLLLLTLVVVALLFLVITVVVREAEPTPTEIAWLAGPNLLQSTGVRSGDAALVCQRYLARHRRHRLAGGLFGILLAVTIGIRWFGSLSVGIGRGSPLADLFFCAISGVVVGALSAESFRLTPTAQTKRAASLSVRPSPARNRRVVLSRAIAFAAVAVGVTAALTGHGSLALAMSMILVVPLGVAEVVMVVVSGRSRPVMSDRARHLDERLRAFAESSLSHLHLATALLMLGWTIAKVEALTGLLAGTQFLVVIVCVVVSVVMMRRAAPRPSDRVKFPDGALFA